MKKLTCLQVIVAAAVIWLCYSYTQTHTWVDDVATVPVPPGPVESNLDPPLEFWNTTNTARLVTDRVTGEQVLVIGSGWREAGGVVYRIMRRVTVKVGGLKKTGFYWSAETRNLDELQPIPSI